MDIFNVFKQHVLTNRLITHQDRLLLGISGGVDSMVLLNLMHRLRYILGLHLMVVHVNHHWRKESHKDQHLVETSCQKLGMDCIVFHASASSKKTEDAARRDRFKFFTRGAKKFRTNKIILAHHQDDVAETVLMRLLRGTGMQGLRGILTKNTVNGLEIIRPLLTMSRKQIVAFATAQRISFVVDKSNTDVRFLRNRIRHDVIPYLATINPDINAVLNNLAEQSNIDYAYLNNAVELFLKRHAKKQKSGNFSLSIEHFKKAPLAIQRLLIKKHLEHTKNNAEQITWLDVVQTHKTLLNQKDTSRVLTFPVNQEGR